jgi:hypothetical protein
MSKLRVLHTRNVTGDILINDIDQGMPVDYLDENRKQDVYVTYNLKKIVGNTVVEDPSLAGFVDLVQSDKVKLSRDRGVLKGLVDEGLISVEELAVGAGNPPVITAVTQDRTGGGSGTDDDQVVITGTGFLSSDPYTSKVFLTNDSGDTNELDRDLLISLGGGNQFTDTTIVVNFGSTVVIETIAVESEGVRVEFAVTAI